MRRLSRIHILLFFLIFTSCTNTKVPKIQREHGDCNVTTLYLDNSKNDTNRIVVKNAYVFDTTANLIKGVIIDQTTGFGLEFVDIDLFNFSEKIVTTTNKQGEFQIFQNLKSTDWNIVIRKPGYICMYIVNVLQTGGIELLIKIQKD